MNLAQNEIQSHRSKNLNNSCSEKLPLFSEFDNEELVDNDEVNVIETERKSVQILQSNLIRLSHTFKLF